MMDRMQIAMLTEQERVRRVMAEAVAEMEADEGNIRFFAQALAVAVFELVVVLDGPEPLFRLAGRVAARQRAAAN